MRDDIPENIRIPETPLTAASQVVGASLFSWPSAFPCSSGPTTTCIISDMDHTQMSAHSQSSTPTPEPEVRHSFGGDVLRVPCAGNYSGHLRMVS